MSRPLKFAIWCVAIVLILLISAVVVVKAVFTRERILTMLTPKLEEAINRKMAIADAGISFWGGVGVWLGDVTIENKPGYSLQPLLAIHKVEFKARMLPLLIGQVRLDRVHLESPSLLLEFDGIGHSNVSDFIRRPRTSTGAVVPVSPESVLAAPLPVGNIVLSDGELIIDYYKSQRRIDVHGIRLAVTADNGLRPQSISITADLAVDSFSVSDPARDWSVPEGIPHAYGAGRLDTSEKSITFDSLMVSAFGSVISLQGAVRANPGITEIQFNANLAPIEISDVVKQLHHAGFLKIPPEIEGKISGDMQANVALPLPAATTPDWLVRFDLTDIRYRPEGWRDPLTIPRIELRGEAQTISWTMTSGKIPGGTFSMSGAIDKVFYQNPDLSAHLAIECDSASAVCLPLKKGGPSAGGDLHLDVNAFGPVKAWRGMRFNGRCTSEKLLVTNRTWAVDTVTLAMDWELNGHDLTLHRTDWRAGSSVGHLTGAVAELTPSVLASFKTLDVPRARLDLNCPYLNLDEFIGDSTQTPEVAEQSEPQSSVPVISADGQISCDTLRYSQMNFTEVRSPFTLRDNVLNFEPASARLFEGPSIGALRWEIADWQSPRFAAELRADSVQADSLVTRFFGWPNAVDGQIDFAGQFSGIGRNRAQIVPTLIGAGRMTMRTGTLDSLPFLDSVGAALGLPALKRPRPFHDLLVTFKIVNERIVTDSLRFATDDARWSAIGSYGFDQTLDYNVGVTLLPGRTSGLATLLKGSQLRFGLSGSTSNLKVDLDVKSAGRALIENLLTPRSDSTEGNATVDDLLKSLFRKKKP